MSYVFVAFLVVVSGFIAYWGDLLGRRMGKRRLTLFGLRPRHTAIVMTTITGMVIALIAFATMFVASSEFRRLLREGHQLIEQNESLIQKNVTLKKDVASLKTQQTDLRARMEAAESGTRAAELRAGKLQTAVKLRSAELLGLQRQFGDAERQLRAERAKLAYTQIARRTAEKQLVVAWEAVKKYNRMAVSGRVEVENVINRPVIGRDGEEVARAVIRPSALVQRDLRALMLRGSRTMADRGAVKGANGLTVTIVPAQFMWVDSKGKSQVKKLAESERLRQAAKLIAQSKNDLVVILRIKTNTVKGEPALVDISIYNNNLAFRKGDTISSAVVDGSQSAGSVFLSLIRLLRQDVRKSAEEAKVIPVFDPDDPGVGTISGPDQWDELIDLVNAVKSKNALVVVRVLAEQDIYSAGPMTLSSLRFDIKAPSTVSALSRRN